MEFLKLAKTHSSIGGLVSLLDQEFVYVGDEAVVEEAEKPKRMELHHCSYEIYQKLVLQILI